MPPNKNIPLCIDLDETLVATDMLLESILLLVKHNPLYFALLPFWLMKGRAYLKHRIYELVEPDVEYLPYNRELIEYIKEEKAKGRKIVLSTAANQKIADKIGEHLGLFDKVLGSSETNNFKGNNKRVRLVELFGEKGYDYAGDSNVDMVVWESANGCILVNTSKKLHARAARKYNVIKVIESTKSTVKLVAKQIRVYQWVKNFLIFMPFIMAHKLEDPAIIINSIYAFFAFCFTASSIYIYNDLIDLHSDRVHPRKRFRPIASGDLSIATGLVLAPILLFLGIAIGACFLNGSFLLTLLFYLSVTTAYSFLLKRIAILDIIVLASLYTIRLLAGAYAADVPASPWMLGFSMFIFLSLATVKRYTELLALKKLNKTTTSGRGYHVEDINLLLAVGPASGYLSVLIFALYVNSKDMIQLYDNPGFLWLVAPLLLFWITRIWLLANRGEMHDDPIVFTGKDPVSYIIGAMIALLIFGASI